MRIKLMQDTQIGESFYSEGDYLPFTVNVASVITSDQIKKKIDFDMKIADNLMNVFEGTLGKLSVISDWGTSTAKPVSLSIMQKVFTWKPTDSKLISFLKQHDSSEFTLIVWFYTPSEEKASEQSIIEGSILLMDYYLEGVFSKKLWTEYFDLSNSDFKDMATNSLDNFKSVIDIEMGA